MNDKINNKLNIIYARDEMIKICKTIWSSRTPEHLDGCRKMLTNYIGKHGDNVGVTFIELELARQERLNGMFAKMGMVQEKLQKTKGEQLDIKEGKKK